MKRVKSASGKMKTYGSFSEWKKDQSASNQKLISALERLIKKTAPRLVTTVKWGQGCWTDGNSHRLFIHAEDDHVQFGFYNGSSLKDPHKLLAGNGKYVRHVKVRTVKDIDRETFTDLIVQVIAKS